MNGKMRIICLSAPSRPCCHSVGCSMGMTVLCHGLCSMLVPTMCDHVRNAVCIHTRSAPLSHRGRMCSMMPICP